MQSPGILSGQICAFDRRADTGWPILILSHDYKARRKALLYTPKWIRLTYLSFGVLNIGSAELSQMISVVAKLSGGEGMVKAKRISES
jgi:hypothetical protein